MTQSLPAAPAFVLTWLSTAGACVLAAAVTPWLVVVPVAVAVVASFAALAAPVSLRAAAAAGMAIAPIVVVEPLLTWPVAAVMGALALVTPQRRTSGILDLQRHLAWCRRRGETAAILVFRAPADAASSPDEVRHSLRLTDSVQVLESLGGYTAIAIVDTSDLEVAGLEDRVRAQLGTDDVEFGWSTFPDDGVTLEVLERVAWEDLSGRRERVPSSSRRTPAAVGATS